MAQTIIFERCIMYEYRGYEIYPIYDGYFCVISPGGNTLHEFTKTPEKVIDCYIANFEVI